MAIRNRPRFLWLQKDWTEKVAVEGTVEKVAEEGVAVEIIEKGKSEIQRKWGKAGKKMRKEEKRYGVSYRESGRRLPRSFEKDL